MTDSPETPRLPRVLHVGDAKPSRDVRSEVQACLERGDLVGLPTETVYGIAARADDPDAVARLRAAKGRDSAAGLTWHATAREVIDLFDAPRGVVLRLVERYWPGPLTLVMPGVPEGLELVSQDGWTGVRLPAHRAALGLLQGLDFPVVASSANRTGELPETTASGVAARFEGSVSIVVDGGPCQLTRASAVLRVGNGRFELLREGLLLVDELRRTGGLRIAFVCTGNTCRSPMAEGIARDAIAERLEVARDAQGIATFGFEVASMGVAASPGSPPSTHAVTVLAARGVEIGAHRSSLAIPEVFRDFDRVYCLTSSHRAALLSLLPPSSARRIELLDPEGTDIADPIGGPESVYAACAEQIRTAILARLDDWV